MGYHCFLGIKYRMRREPWQASILNIFVEEWAGWFWLWFALGCIRRIA